MAGAFFKIMPSQLSAVIFLSLFFIGYLCVNLYLLGRMRRAWAPCAPRWAGWLLAFLLTCAYPYARIFSADGRLALVEDIANYWMGFSMFLFAAFVVAEIAWAVLRRKGGSPRARARVFALAFLAALVVALWGHWRMGSIAVEHYAVSVAKPADGRERMRVVLVSDLHLGRERGADWLEGVVALINAQNPDMVVIAGDLVDYSASALESAGVAEAFRKLRAPLGVYAVRGNHDVFEPSLPRMQSALEKCGVVLLDDAATKAGGVSVVGRVDKGTGARAPLAHVMRGVDKRAPILLIDHRPDCLEEAAAQGVDIQFSGHTHGGQFFPAMLITKLVYACDHGLWEKGDFRLIVSSGAGLWGPPYRVGSQAEIAVVDIAFQKYDNR